MSDDHETVPAGKMRLYDQPEHRLSHFCGLLADRIILSDGPCWWTAQDTGTALFKQGSDEEKRRARLNWENHRRFMGIKPNQLDWRVYQSPVYAEIELKFAATEAAALKALTQGQRDTITALDRHRVRSAVAWSVVSFYEALRRIGFRLHGNAANIAVEIEARWRAADEAARGPDAKSKPKRASKPRAAKPSARSLARVRALHQQGIRFAFLLAFIASARADPPPGIALDPALHAWFERQHSVTGAWCCDEGDGHILRDDEWRTAGNHFEISMNGEWRSVPGSAMRDPVGGPNPMGAAIAWYRGDHLYCFAPGFVG